MGCCPARHCEEPKATKQSSTNAQSIQTCMNPCIADLIDPALRRWLVAGTPCHLKPHKSGSFPLFLGFDTPGISLCKAPEKDLSDPYLASLSS